MLLFVAVKYDAPQPVKASEIAMKATLRMDFFIFSWFCLLRYPRAAAVNKKRKCRDNFAYLTEGSDKTQAMINEI